MATRTSSTHYTPQLPGRSLPIVDAQGTTRECGKQLGLYWREALTLKARTYDASSKPWWKAKQFSKLISRYAPHVPDLFQTMAQGAGIEENLIGDRAAPVAAKKVSSRSREGCTSFALSGRVTLRDNPISGQTKDTPLSRYFDFQILRLRPTDAPHMLSLTYPGWLFGHGFARGGCAIFRNSLFIEHAMVGLPYDVWGILAQNAPTAHEAAELAVQHGVNMSSHCTIADEQNNIVGLEVGGIAVGTLKPTRGVYVHANNARVASVKKQKHTDGVEFHIADSENRTARMTELLEQNRGRLTAPLCLAAFCDHQNFPASICRHQAETAMTTAAVVVEPTRGLMHVTLGPPCQGVTTTYALDATGG